jgi:hypothetical protein
MKRQWPPIPKYYPPSENGLHLAPGQWAKKWAQYQERKGIQTGTLTGSAEITGENQSQ